MRVNDNEERVSEQPMRKMVDNGIIYEIFPRSYSASGDLDGITADIARIADLGVDAIWMMPIFEGPSDHGYEITNYTVEQLHERRFA